MTVDDAPLTPRVQMPEDKPTAVREPWERQEGEGEREWTCFKAYRDMPVPRNLHRSGYLGGVKISSAELSRWYNTWKWAERTEAYDVLTDRIIQTQRKKTIERHTDEATADQLAMLAKLDEVISREVEKLLTASTGQNGVGLIKTSDLKGLIEASIKMRRLLTDQTTEKIGTESTDLSDLSVDDLVTLREELLKKKQGSPK